MSSPLCKLLQVTPTNTLVKELMINGEDVSKVQKFVKYDKYRDLAYFINNSGSTFICIGERIDMIEFTSEEEQKPRERKYRALYNSRNDYDYLSYAQEVESEIDRLEKAMEAFEENL